MSNIRTRVPSEVLKGGYSDEEVAHIYELSRLHLENGRARQAEIILRGLTEVAPDFAPAWLALSYISLISTRSEEAIQHASRTLKVDPDSSEAMLFLVACYLNTGDYNSAGTYLGEISERIESGVLDDPKLVRFFKAQLARYQNR